MTECRGLRGIPAQPPLHPMAGVRRWRRQQLMAAGYDELSAQRLTRAGDVDLHAILVQREARTAPERGRSDA